MWRFVACLNAELLGTQQGEGRDEDTCTHSSTKQKLGRDFLQNSFSLTQLRST